MDHVRGHVKWIMPVICVVPFLTFVSSSAASSQDWPVETASVSVEDTVEIIGFSGVSTCEHRGLIAIRTDEPDIAENRVHHILRVIDVSSRDVLFEGNVGDTMNTFGFSEAAGMQFSPDCDDLYFRALFYDEVQVWRVDLGTGEQNRITYDEANVLSFRLSKDGTSLTYQTSAPREEILAAERREAVEGIVIDQTVRPGWDLTESSPVFGRWSAVRRWGTPQKTTGSGHLLSTLPRAYRTISTGRTKVLLKPRSSLSIKGTSVETEGLESSDGKEILRAIGLKADSGMLFVATLETTPYGGIIDSQLRYSTQQEDPHEVGCKAAPCFSRRIFPVGWLDDRLEVYFISETQLGGGAGLFKWDIRSDRVEKIYHSDGFLGSMTDDGTNRSLMSHTCPVIGSRLYCTVEGPGTPPKLVEIDLATTQSRLIYDPNVELRSKFTLRTERFQWTDKKGRENSGVLVFPQGHTPGKRYPLVLTTYNCPGFLRGGVADGAPEYALAGRGYVVLCVERNQRVVDHYSDKKSYAEMRYEGYLDQMESSISALDAKGHIDPGRVGVTGMSMSTQMIAYGLARSDRIHVASLRGISVFEPAHIYLWRRTMVGSEFRYVDHGVVGNQQEIEAALDRLSVAANAHRIRAPILVQAADSEYSWALPGFAALEENGNAIEMIVFPNETHVLHQPVHKYINMRRNLLWLDFWLRGYEDSDKGFAPQYQRWRKLRLKHCARMTNLGQNSTLCRNNR